MGSPLQKTVAYSRRLTKRVEVPQDVYVFWSCNGRDELSRVSDLSVGGLFVETPNFRAVGAAAKVHFLVSEGQIRADALVRHVEPGQGLGLKFTAVDEHDRGHFSGMIKRLLT
jgi:PilZ domain